MKSIKLWVIILMTFNCNSNTSQITKTKKKTETKTESKVSLTFKSSDIAYGFDYPVGKPDAKGYYNAQPFTENNHLGDDWNAVTGGNSDLGDPIYAIANGYVKSAEDIKGGWGNVIRIIHQLPNKQKVESLYAHCDSILIENGQWVKKGDQIGTIGNADGQYYAHLHLEIRDNINMPIGGGYSSETAGYLNPTSYIKNHRKLK